MILTVIPTRYELQPFVESCAELGYRAAEGTVGRIAVRCFSNLGLTVAQGGLGKAEFAVRTQHLIDSAEWNLVICAGAAGALTDGLEVGDVVIGTETVEHDIRNKFGKPLLPRFKGGADGLSNFRRALQAESDLPVHYGPIASGDQDVVDAETRSFVHQRTRALAVAWEGAGGARACRLSGVPFLEVRGVTDAADHHAAREYERNMKQAMANVARAIVALAASGPQA